MMMHMHGFVGASSNVTASDHVDIATTSNYVVLVSNSTKVEM
jgi:hypothetical protein